MPYAATVFAIRPAFRIAFGLKVVSADRIPSNGPLVVVSNHESFLDGFVVAAALTGRQLTFLSAARLFDTPSTGLFLRSIGALPVGHGSLGSLRTAIAILEGGGTVAVFPEGGIARDGVLGGAAYLALKTDATVLPLHIAGAKAALPPGSRWPVPAPITVRVGTPVPASELSGSSNTKRAVAEGTEALTHVLAGEWRS
jgi:1-acyl-sn-glycerol-3-phosphate acyltransferase